VPLEGPRSAKPEFPHERFADSLNQDTLSVNYHPPQLGCCERNPHTHRGLPDVG
jgi:hypothetical protein